MSIRTGLVAQFRKPHGVVGALAGWVMANRPSNVERNRWTVGLLDVQPDDHVLEIGCGPGLSLAACVAKLGGGRVVGIDHSELMIVQAAKRNATALNEGTLALHTGGLDILPKLSLEFTKAFSVNVAQFFPDKVAAFRAMAEAIAPGGLMATTYQPRTPKPTKADALDMAQTFTAALEAAGFIELRTEYLAMRPAPVVCVLARKAQATVPLQGQTH